MGNEKRKLPLMAPPQIDAARGLVESGDGVADADRAHGAVGEGDLGAAEHEARQVASAQAHLRAIGDAQLALRGDRGRGERHFVEDHGPGARVPDHRRHQRPGPAAELRAVDDDRARARVGADAEDEAAGEDERVARRDRLQAHGERARVGRADLGPGLQLDPQPPGADHRRVDPGGDEQRVAGAGEVDRALQGRTAAADHHRRLRDQRGARCDEENGHVASGEHRGIIPADGGIGNSLRHACACGGPGAGPHRPGTKTPGEGRACGGRRVPSGSGWGAGRAPAPQAPLATRRGRR
jgi:hypothetical protein